MKTWECVASLGILIWMATDAHAGTMWKYTDAQGHVHFTDTFDAISPQLRHRAEPYVPRDVAPTLPRSPTPTRRPVESYRPEEARAQLLAGKLTEDEVRWLVDQGVLRTTELGDAIRFAAPPTTAPHRPHSLTTDAQPDVLTQQNPWHALVDLVKLSAVGNLLLFRDTIERAFRLKHTLMKGPQA